MQETLALRWPMGWLGLLLIGLNFFTLPAAAQSNTALAYTFTTLAGLASIGSADGVGDAAHFFFPVGVTADSAGNLYVADAQNHTIRKVTAAGVVSTLAGFTGSPGGSDGTGSNARFNFPFGIATNSAGNLYVADTFNHTIRMVTPAGVVSTFAGSAGSFGTNDGVVSNARFNFPHGIAADRAGNVYVADTYNHTIRKITSTGVVSTFAGSAGSFGTNDGVVSNARFNQPDGVAADSAGNVYVADTGNHTVRKITSAGVVSTLAGLAETFGSSNGTGSNARFNQPYGVAVDRAGNLYVADTYNFTIRKITSAGVVSTLAGLPGNPGWNDGTGDNAQFYYPQGIAVDSAGNLYVADSFNHTIRKVTAAGVVSTFAGSAGSFGTNDGVGNNARFLYPEGIAVDSAGNLYVAEMGNSTIRKITAAGMVSTVAGLARSFGTNDGVGSSARFYFPGGIAADRAGNLYVADTGNHTIRKITSAGVVSTLAGLPGNPGWNDGTGDNAQFYYPQGIAADCAGNLYVADSENFTIRKITSDGVVSTLAGSAGNFGSSDGTGGAVRFVNPFGIAVDSEGNLYVADTFNNTIRKGAFRQYTPINPVPYTQPPMNGQLTVTLFPTNANGQWRFPWELGWHNSGYTASNLVRGDYPIEFRNVPGWLAVPLSGPLTLTDGGMVSITHQYYPTISAEDPNSTSGSLTVYLGPLPPAGAGWGFLGDNTPVLPTGFTTNLLPGTYLIEFSAVSGRIKPPSQAVQVKAGLPAFLSVNYLLAASPPGNVYPPFPVPANRVNDETNYPFGFNGQLQSDIGYGSGVAVQPNVVLTAAHLVFNDQTLSYVSHAHWFFRRDAGVSEPLPQVARALYLLSGYGAQLGYAAQRTNDLASGYSPDQSTPPSRNTDVAALWFSEYVADGGYGGYLPSDEVPNTWLTSTALKMLVGYPVDGSQFGTNVIPGKMYQTDPQPYPLALALDPVPEQQQVYVAPWLLSYPGNSGGPLYVQLNGYYYPAAVYLGTLFSGSQPYASVVRAIDSNVVNMITLAQRLGDSGTNNTGGGVITINPSQAISANNLAYVQFLLAPPAAVRAGAAWRLQCATCDTNSNYSPSSYAVPVDSTNALAAEFKPIPGWNLPTNQTVVLLPGDIRSYTAFYTELPPRLSYSSDDGLRLFGASELTYRIESTTNLRSMINWITNTTITLNNLTLTNNSQVIGGTKPGNSGRRFFRAVRTP